MPRRLLHLLVVVALLTGCAQNAILEFQIELPPNPPGETWFAKVEVISSSDDGLALFSSGFSTNLRTIPLEDATRWDCLSIESSNPMASVLLKVRFCQSPECGLTDERGPRHLYRLETPFYIGSRTYYRARIPSVPTCASSDDCAVGACIGEVCGCSSEADCPEGFACVAGEGCVSLVDRCSIEGCIGGTGSSFCSGDTGEHFCERNPGLLRDETFMCSLP